MRGTDNSGYTDNQQIVDGTGNPTDLPPSEITPDQTGEWAGPGNPDGNFTRPDNMTGNWTTDRNRTGMRGNRIGPPSGDWNGTLQDGNMGPPPGNWTEPSQN